MRALLAIDPGPTQSAWLVLGAGGGIRQFSVWPNERLRQLIRWDDLSELLSPDVDRIVIEKVEGYGMPVGAEVFETVFWSGRFAEAAHPVRVDRIGRKAVKVHLCGTSRAKDPNVRQALIDRYGGSAAIGRKATPGPLYGIAGDLWSALAVAVTWADRQIAADYGEPT
jgi:hypothetical protein